MSDTTTLTKNQALVYRTLSNSETPLSAYAILDLLRDQGFRAPPQVYRALEKLVEIGLVHRIESLNAFVACCHPQCQDRDFIAFAICESCGHVEELDMDEIEHQTRRIAHINGFSPKSTAIEMHGTCQDCTKPH